MEKIIINPTLNPQLHPKKKRLPVIRSYYQPFFYFAVPACVLDFVLAGFFYRLLPPEIPLFNSMSQVTDKLTPAIMIFLLPAIALIINLIHALVIYFGRKYDVLLLKMFSYFTVFLQLLLLAVLLRLIMVMI